MTNTPPATIHLGDCIEVMRTLPENSVDAIVTDPPYGLGFMGKAWDELPPGEEWARECLRVLKPGGHLLAFGGSRTWHRLAVAVEDAGFEVRDSIAWLYGSGFPKSLDVSKAIDKVNGEGGRLHKFTEWMRSTGITSRELNIATGTNMGGHYLTAASQPAIPTPDLWALIRPLVADVPEWVDLLIERVEAEREVIEERRVTDRRGDGTVVGLGHGGNADITAPATDDARKWAGFGTALKPAFEPIVVARKPLVGTVAANVIAHGTGALNIDGCRVGSDSMTTIIGADGFGASFRDDGWKPEGRLTTRATPTAGRWPANVVLDESQAEALDQQSGVSRDGTASPRSGGFGGGMFGDGTPDRVGAAGFGGSGGASRFFYVAKAPTRERPKVDGVAHPTVKPLALMRWLVRLVTPPGGTVLEPFAGSGTTVEACALEGFSCIAIEREPDYLPLIQARLARVEAAQPEPAGPSLFDMEETA